jgi:GNAT acetyltransferase-like protein
MSSLIEPSGPGLTGFIEERFLVPTYSSGQAPMWIAAHRALSMPFQLQAPARRYVAQVEGQELKIIAIGRSKRFRPIFRRLFGEVQEGDFTATRTIWQPEWLADLDADLVVANVHRWVAQGFRNSGWVIVPESVRWSGDPAQLPPAVPCHSLREDLRKMRRYQYTLEQVAGPEEWDEFHQTMLVPQAMARFGDAAWLPTRRYLKELAAKGVLHFLRRDGERLAGMVSVRHGDTLWLPVSGVRAGDEVLLRQGVGVALFYKVFEWARAQGCRRIDSGRTSSFVNEGVHRNKYKWGLRPAPDPLTHLIAMRIGAAPALRRAFANQPVLMEASAGLELYAGGQV